MAIISGGGLRNQVEYGKVRAKETRMVAETMHGGAARKALLQIADDWEKMARRVEEDEEKIAAEGRLTLQDRVTPAGDAPMTE